MSLIDEESGEKPKKKSFTRIPPIVQRIWFSFWYLIATGATFAAILGCLSPATQVLSLYNTDTNAMISYLANATAFNETQFYHPALPDSWSWGLSGACELYVDSPEHTKCHYAFPPLFSIEQLVEKALSSPELHDTTDIITTWKSALATKPSDPALSVLATSASRRTKSISLLRGAAAAVVFSLLISLATLSSSLALFSPSIEDQSERKYRRSLFGIAVLDFVLFAGALAMFYSGMITGPGAIASAGGGGDSMSVMLEIGSIVVLGALMCRIISIPIISVIIICILGFELLCILFFGYMMLKFCGALAERPLEPGQRYVYSY